MQPVLEFRDVSLKTPTGRALFEGLNVGIGSEHVAVVGRNGVGKSTLLELMAGAISASSGHVQRRGTVHHVEQLEELGEPFSRGELRRRALERARASGADLLLLDEPTLHLDDATVEWLRQWLAAFPGGVVVVSHDRRLLADMRHFFVVSESGCHYFEGSLAALEQHLESEHERTERRYFANLNRLAEEHEHNAQVARGKARKKRRGRCSELDRATPRIRLNQKRDHAQVSHGRLAKLREAKLLALQGWTRATRRALGVELPLELTLPALSRADGNCALSLQSLTHALHGRVLFEGLELRVCRERVAITGPNGAGKTTLLEIMMGERRADSGVVRVDMSKVGYIAQGGRNWQLDEPLLAHLLTLGLTSDDAAALLVAHKFPLALADRPLRSLSPGERARAAMAAIFARNPSVELLVLDEPTFSLDLVGQRALTRALQLWPGGLVVASHDREFLEQLRIDRTIAL
ncbi:MAG TPA: ATP-binding cassette domain-containing protein [Polyangiaceae bacterium]|nr:ATP-binding cassette domain-containing protein [Polyangiaceae bacterium]